MDHVIETELSDFLHPAKMLNNLRVGRSVDFSRVDGELTIEYFEERDLVTFSYYSSNDSEPWIKNRKGSEIITTFNYILKKRLRWINFRL